MCPLHFLEKSDTLRNWINMYIYSSISLWFSAVLGVVHKRNVLPSTQARSSGLPTCASSDSKVGNRAWLTGQCPTWSLMLLTQANIGEASSCCFANSLFSSGRRNTQIIGILEPGSRCSLWLKGSVLINNVLFCWLQKSFELICFKDFSKEIFSYRMVFLLGYTWCSTLITEVSWKMLMFSAAAQSAF